MDVNESTDLKQNIGLSARRTTLIRELRELIGDGPAALYHDACQIVEGHVVLQAPNEILGHLMRELDSAVREVLGGLSATRGSEGGWKKSITDVLTLLEMSTSEGAGKAWLDLPKLHALAHRRRLLWLDRLESTLLKTFADLESIISAVLYSWRKKFLVSVNRVDSILLMPPSQKACVLFLSRTPANYKVLKYFYDRVGIEWLDSLRLAGAFRAPPPPWVNDESRTIYPWWPALEYLVDMAKLAPDKVYEIVTDLPPTENQSVHANILEAALVLQSKYSAVLVEKEASWIRCTSDPEVPVCRNGVRLALHLITEGEDSVALTLLLALFELTEIDGKISSFLDEHEYSRALDSVIQASVSHSLSIGFARILIDQLRMAIAFSSDPDGKYSSWWRSAIEDHIQNVFRDSGYRAILLTSVRDLFEKMMPGQGLEVMKILDEEDSSIFLRLSLHLRRLFPEVDPEGTAEHLLKESSFDNAELHHEYFLLLRDTYQQLDEFHKKAYLRLVQDGLITANWIDFRERNKGQEPSSAEDWQSWRYWRYSKLLPIADYLNDSWKTEFKELEKEFGPRPYVDFMHYRHEGRSIPEGPIAEEALRKLSPNEAIELMMIWPPSEDPMTPSVHDLGRSFSSAVADKPELFTESCSLLQQVRPVYIAAALSGFKQATQNQMSFDWKPVLDLCLFAVSQDVREFGSADNTVRQEEDWSWVRRGIADLICEGLTLRKTAIPISMRDQVWGNIFILQNDPDPNDSFKDTCGEDSDALFAAISSTRGLAIQAAILYGLWLMEYSVGYDRGSISGLESIPELQSILERHLDLRSERSVAIRALYGNWFPWLVVLSEKWVKSKIYKIFPTESSKKVLHEAAWEAYIAHRPVFTQPLLLLAKQYRLALQQLEEQSNEIGGKEKGLAQHVMMSLMRGDLSKLGLEDLVQSLFQFGSDELRGFALEDCGWVLRHPDSAVSDELIQRLMGLYESRVKVARGADDSREYTKEMEAFEVWFEAGVFDEAWSLEQLRRSYEIRSSIRTEHSIVERLMQLSKDHTAEVMNVLTLMIEKNEWGFYGLIDEMKSILKVGLSCPESSLKAVRTVNLLGSMGYLEFRELLKADAST